MLYCEQKDEETVYMLEELSELLDAGFTTVRDMGGTLLAVADVRHVYTFAGGLVQRMDVEQ